MKSFWCVAAAPESELTLFGLGALILILFLLNAARKPITTYGEAKDPPDET